MIALPKERDTEIELNEGRLLHTLFIYVYLNSNTDAKQLPQPSSRFRRIENDHAYMCVRVRLLI